MGLFPQLPDRDTVWPAASCLHPLPGCDGLCLLVLVRLIIAAVKHHDQEQLEERVSLAYRYIALKEVRTGTQLGQEPGGRS